MKSSLVGPVGIEPTTCGLKVRCSTAELKALQTRLIRLRHECWNWECKNWLLFFHLLSPHLLTPKSRHTANMSHIAKQ